MEKVKIKSVIDTGKKWNDKSIYRIELEDGRNGSSFDPDSLKWSGEIELEIKEGKEYEGKKQYIFNSANKSQNSGKFPQKDYAFEKRKTSLECAIEAGKISESPAINSEKILIIAELFYQYLNKK